MITYCVLFLDFVDAVDIQFEQSEYPVGESSKSVSVCVVAVGQLGRTLDLTISTTNGTAIGN